MLRDLLDVSRVTAGQKLPLDIDEMDLSQVVRGVVEELVLCYGPRFQVRMADELRGHWCAKELRRAVWNLLSNSIKHGRPDRPIGVRIERLNDVVRLEVHNHGAPIAPTAMRQIFEPFQRAASATTSFTPGWGLGLTLVRACMEAHGGSVQVRSLPEEGTTFTLLLPPDSRPHYYGETPPPAVAAATDVSH
jgi:signal transduction histidine kinase